MKVFWDAFSCCGLVGGQEFDYYNPDGDIEKLVGAQNSNGVPCAMIVLAEDQYPNKLAAEKAGFTTIQEFRNPKSGNTCFIMTRLTRQNEEYSDEEDDY